MADKDSILYVKLKIYPLPSGFLRYKMKNIILSNKGSTVVGREEGGGESLQNKVKVANFNNTLNTANDLL